MSSCCVRGSAWVGERAAERGPGGGRPGGTAQAGRGQRTGGWQQGREMTPGDPGICDPIRETPTSIPIYKPSGWWGDGGRQDGGWVSLVCMGGLGGSPGWVGAAR